MSEKYKSIKDQLYKNSIWKGECLETIYKQKRRGKSSPQITYKGKLISINRASWFVHNGKIPEGMFVCHTCDNPNCFRIEHLFLGTPSDNMQDMVRKGRDNIFGRKKYTLDQWEKAKTFREYGLSYREISNILRIAFPAVSAHMIRKKIKKGCNKFSDLLT